MIEPDSIDLFRFVSDWHGLPDLPPSALPAGCDWLPAPLREWHILASQWSKPLMRLNQMVEPGDIEVVEGKSVFLEDAACDWRSAFDVECPSVVYESELEEDWVVSSETLQETLIHSALLEAASAGRYRRFCGRVRDTRLPEVLGSLVKVNLGGWQWYNNPNCLIYMSEKIVASVEPNIDIRDSRFNTPEYVDVQIASHDSQALSYLDEIPGIGWRVANTELN
ncbi:MULTISPECIES: hypothetical protein [unclassified Streptomyces]|uniref:hypothetical protein n=1 Tax=unclassified Streptomyces TaxID=2593676 RepID=UPI003656467F